ncbi:MAG: FAD-dependent monooxygenase [Gemmatimonadaceae bacterium]|nr:FAD-dependent monooxygenase [Gemmatimonadaceae bacterium]
MQVQGMQVVVAGAATAGAATALLLARAGATVRVLDRVPEVRAAGAGIALAANGQAVLERLQLNTLLDQATQINGARIVDANERTLLAPPDGTDLRIVTRAALQAALFEAMRSTPGIAITLGATVEAATPDGRVTVRHAATGRTDDLQADLVVGADGVHSRVREQGGFAAEVRRSGIHYVRAISPTPPRDALEAWTSAGLFGMMPLDRGSYLYASCGTPELAHALKAADLDAFRRAWQRAFAPSAALLAPLQRFDELLVHEVIRVTCRQWHDGRLVLVGDAAHAMAPNLGQGGNSALVDAVVLMESLRNAKDLPEALAQYTARRRPAVQRVADTSARLGQVSEWTQPAISWLRDRVLMPLASRGDSSRMMRDVLQEDPGWLRGR